MYLHNFTCKEDVISNFDINPTELKDANIILASYTYESYSGSAYVLYEKNGKMYEVHGSHCSCNGLEDCWSPELVTKEDLKFRLENGEFDYEDEYRSVLEKIVHSFEFDKKMNKVIE